MNGKLISPEGWEIAMGEVLAVPLMRQQISTAQAEIRKLTTVISIQDQPAPKDFPDWVYEMRA